MEVKISQIELQKQTPKNKFLGQKTRAGRDQRGQSTLFCCWLAAFLSHGVEEGMSQTQTAEAK